MIGAPGEAEIGSLDLQRGKAVDNGGARYSAMESALRPAVTHRHSTVRGPSSAPSSREGEHR